MKRIFSVFLLTVFFLTAPPGLSFAQDPLVSSLAKNAGQGDTHAQIRLGTLYANCSGVPCDADRALTWLNKAADQGSAEAAYDIGNLYVSPTLLLHPGSSMQQDGKAAVKWWRKAAEQGYIPAQNKLGEIYESGMNVSDFSGKYRRQRDVVHADYAEAVKWYSTAATQGDIPSAAALGDLYAQGHGVPQDFVQAYVWYSRSASVSAARAHDLLNKMTPAQVAEGERLTKGWRPPSVALTQKASVPAGLLTNPFVRQARQANAGPAAQSPVIHTTWQTAVSGAGVGDRMPDGTLYLGKYRGVRWFVMDMDAKDQRGRNLLMDHDAAEKYAKNLKAHGHADWTIPDQDILQKMFGNRHKGSFTGTYDEQGNFSSGWYRSSTQNAKFTGNTIAQWFSNGNSGWVPKSGAFSVRCVRGVTEP